MPKAFSAGGDIGYFYNLIQQGGEVNMDSLISKVGNVTDGLKRMSKLVISSVSGPTPSWDKVDIDAGGQPASVIKGGSVYDHEMSFAFIRGGHIDAAVLGTLQVDQEGNIANWTIPGKMVPGMGGAMDLCAGVKKIIVATDHCEKSGKSKILKKCTLPLTGVHCVTDIVPDEIGVMS